jgi:hypothetical protein
LQWTSNHYSLGELFHQRASGDCSPARKSNRHHRRKNQNPGYSFAGAFAGIQPTFYGCPWRGWSAIGFVGQPPLWSCDAGFALPFLAARAKAD